MPRSWKQENGMRLPPLVMRSRFIAKNPRRRNAAQCYSTINKLIYEHKIARSGTQPHGTLPGVRKFSQTLRAILLLRSRDVTSSRGSMPFIGRCSRWEQHTMVGRSELLKCSVGGGTHACSLSSACISEQTHIHIRTRARAHTPSTSKCVQTCGSLNHVGPIFRETDWKEWSTSREMGIEKRGKKCLYARLRFCCCFSYGARVVCWTRDRKVANSNPGRSGGRIFFSRVNFVSWYLFGVRSTPVLPQWHVKDPGHSAKSASGRLHLNTHTPLTQRSRSGLTMPLCRHSENLSGNKLTRNLSGNIRPQSSQLAEPLWTDPDIKSEISVRELISI